MSGSSLLVETPTGLETARAAYGRGTQVWAHRAHRCEPTLWLGLSGTSSADYNQALLHGEDAREAAAEVLGQIEEVGRPSVIGLAGAGLDGAQVLSDAGWVCVAALPFMYRPAMPGRPDPRVRALSDGELASARQVLSATFDVPDDSAEALFRPSLLERPGVRTWGLFDPDLVSVAVTVEVGDGYYVGWALATAPWAQHRGYGAGLLRHIDAWFDRHGHLGSLHVGTLAGARLYAARGHETLEHWQLWSKPRWLLGS